MNYNFSDRVKDLKGNAIREIFKLLAQPGVISFAGGLPASSMLPVKEIETLSAKVLREDGVAVTQYGATEGYLPLRQTLTKYVERVGINGCEIDDTLIISGGQQGIDLMFKCFLNKGDVLLVQNPTYLAALHIAKTYEAKAVGVKASADGLDLNDLEDKIQKLKPKLLYLVPNFSNPSGKTLTVETRKKTVEICAKYSVVIVEDDPYRELRYDGKPLPSLKSFDKSGTVVYICSFSKTISPALRVGVAVGDKELIRKLTVGKQATDVHTSILSQAIVNKFIEGGYLEKQIEKALPVYKEKKDEMLAAIAREMPKYFKYTKPEGGLFIWGEFENGLNAAELFSKAVENKVAYVSGVDFYADGVSGANNIRLNFSNATKEQINVGIEKLGKLFSGQ